MPIRKAIKDSFGLKDVMMDTLDTLKGDGFSYRSFEPSEGVPHMGSSRTSRIMAGLRYSNITTKKHWLEPAPTSRFLNSGRGMNDEIIDQDSEPLQFEDPDSQDEMETLYDASRKMEFGDYNYPVIDFRVPLWRQARQERRLQRRGYGSTPTNQQKRNYDGKRKKGDEERLLGPREGCIDVIVKQGKGNYVLVDDLSDDEEANISSVVEDELMDKKLPASPIRNHTLSDVRRNLSSSSSTPTIAKPSPQRNHLANKFVKPSFSTPQKQASSRYPKPIVSNTSPQPPILPTTTTTTINTNNSPSMYISPSEEDAPIWQWPDKIAKKNNTTLDEDDLLSGDVWK